MQCIRYVCVCVCVCHRSCPSLFDETQMFLDDSSEQLRVRTTHSPVPLSHPTLPSHSPIPLSHPTLPPHPTPSHTPSDY